MHKLLERQLGRFFGRTVLENIPKQWMQLLEVIDEAYHQADDDRLLLERSLELTSQELLSHNEELKKQINERAQTENALKTSELRYHQLLEAVIDYAIISLDKDGLVETWNRGAERLMGYSAQEVTGHPITAFFAQDDPSNNVAEELLNRVRKEGRADHTGWYLRKDKSRYWADVIMTALYDHYGNIQGFTYVTRDTTERKLFEEQLQKQAEELAESNTELEQFAYVASHDLQEPLRMISSYTQLLARRYKGRLDKDADDFINYAVEGSTRMQALINDLLQYSRITTSKRPFILTDCNQILEQSVNNLNIAIKESDTKLTHGPLPSLTVDATQIGQVFQNLISNAIKFRNKQSPEINITANRNGFFWHFVVADNGIGIDPQYAERIFQLFQRLHGRQEYPGTGIGLTICKKIIEKHGGMISVGKSSQGGTAFTFTLPVHNNKEHVNDKTD